jgi:hypothetical protein
MEDHEEGLAPDGDDAVNADAGGESEKRPALPKTEDMPAFARDILGI